MSEQKSKILLPARFEPDPDESAIRIKFSDGSRSEPIKTPEDTEQEISMNLQTGRLTSHEASELRERSRFAQKHESAVHLFLQLLIASAAIAELEDEDDEDGV